MFTITFIDSSSSENNNNNNQDDDGNDPDNDEQEPVIVDKPGITADPTQGALASTAVPEVFPVVPVIPVQRNPVFPRFVKMLEVRNK